MITRDVRHLRALGGGARRPRDGSLDLNILIRTMVLDGNRLTFRAGSGIVADSKPELELAETRAKAEGLKRALTQ